RLRAGTGGTLGQAAPAALGAGARRIANLERLREAAKRAWAGMAVRQLAGHEEDGACNAVASLRACGSRERWAIRWLRPRAGPWIPGGTGGACLPAPARPDRGDGTPRSRGHGTRDRTERG